MTIRQMYRDDLLNRFANHSFTETVVGSFILVEFSFDDTIDSVTDSGGTARFNFASGPTLVVGQQVVNTGFITNTAYNGTHTVSATDGTTYFEVTGVSFGTNETGSMSALIATAQKINDDDAYREIRFDLIGGFEILITITEVQKNALTDNVQGMYIYNQGNTVEVYDGVGWAPA